MICFRLKCYEGHEFDSWFRDSKSYEDLQSKKLISCPSCGICDVEKAITAPHIVKSKDIENRKPSGKVDNALLMKELLRRVNSYISENFENVGERFAQEARKIVNGDAPTRDIYGTANAEEAKALHEEGIEVVVLPTTPAFDA